MRAVRNRVKGRIITRFAEGRREIGTMLQGPAQGVPIGNRSTFGVATTNIDWSAIRSVLRKPSVE